MLERYLRILDVIVSAGQPLSAREIANNCDVPLSTAYRLLHQLSTNELVTKTPNEDKYWLGLKCITYGGAVLNSLRIRDVAAFAMRKLSDRVGATVHLTVRDGDYGVYIEKIRPPNQAFDWHTEVGRRASLCTGASMKILLAYLDLDVQEGIIDRADFSGSGPGVITDKVALREQLDKIREQGWAFTKEELSAGAVGLSAPIRDWNDNVVAGLTVTSPRSHISPFHIKEILPVLLESAGEISRLLGNTSK